MKTIHFNNCKDCPYKDRYYDTENNKIDKVCAKYLYTVISDINIVPTWCPIPDDI